MAHSSSQIPDLRGGSPELRASQKTARDLRAEARRKYQASKLTRREDTRRKILVGAIVLAKVERGEFEETLLMKWLEELLIRKDDRELFGLPLVRRGP